MFSKLVLFLFYLNCVLCSLTHYKASLVDVSKTEVSINKYESLIVEAAKYNVDLLLLTPTKIDVEDLDSCVNNLDNHDEVVKVISKAVKKAGIYVVAAIYEKTRCQYQDETIFNNMVFGRDGAIVASYRTPVSTTSKCNTTEPKIVKFTTDFGVTFALVTDEDIILHGIEYFDDVKNFIVSGFTSNVPYLLAEQFTSSWSFVNKVNVVSPSGLFGADIDTLDNLIIAEFQKSGGSSPLITTSHDGLHHLHHTTKSMSTESSIQGYSDTVCDGSFCCNIYVKTTDKDPSVHYSLSAHSDVIHIGAQGVTLQACSVSSKTSSDIKFDKIKIISNFTKNSTMFPSMSTSEPSIINNIIIENNSVQLHDVYVRTFSVLGIYNNDNVTDEHTDYISYQNISDFFDYVWIRVRVLIFIVSIYILEMM